MMKLLAGFSVLLMIAALSGCGKKQMDPAAENVDGIPEADTAGVDTSGIPESVPPADAQEPTSAQSEEPSMPQENAQASADTSLDSSVPSSASSADPVPAAGTGEMASYSVQKGDTLMKIAFNVYGDIARWKQVYDLNKDSLQNHSILKVGASLKYEKPAMEPTVERNGDPYLIKTGDSLGKIADDIYAKRNKWKKLYENNRTLIKDPNRIYAGFYLYYQITEEEKKEAEEIKAKRGGSALSHEPVKAVVAPTPAVAKAKSPAPAPVASAPTSFGTSGGGLDALAAPGNGRAPASK
jgi:LysM repeat protein